MVRIVCASACIALVGCGVELAVPDGAQVTCASDAECPRDMYCRGDLCVPSDNTAPTVSVGAIVRSIDVISIPATVFDEDDDAVQLAVSLSEDDGEPVHVADFAITREQLGQEQLLEWDGTELYPAADYHSGLRFHLTPTDGTTAGRTVESGLFEFGNGAPGLASLSIDLDADGEVTGLAVVRLQVTDPESDPVDVTGFEVSLLNDFDLDAQPVSTVAVGNPEFPAGGLTGLATDGTTPVEHAVVWDSEASQPIDASDVLVRARVADLFATTEWVTFGPFTLDNTTSAPVIALGANPARGVTVSDQVSVDFTITDDDNDACLVVVEVSADGFARMLAASSTDTIGLLPGSYSFVWESTQLGFETYSNVRLHFSISDPADVGVSQSTEVFNVDNTGVVGNAAPNVSIGAVVPAGGGRFVSTVQIPFTVSDSENDPVDLQVYYSLDPDAPQQDWHLAEALGTRDPSLCATGANVLCHSTDLGGVASDSAGLSYIFEWDALSNANLSATRDLLLVPGVLVDDVPTDLVAATYPVYFRIIPTDDPPAGTPKTGNAATSVPFAIGNEPPTVVFSDETTALSGAEVGGDVPLEFELTDPLADLAAVEIEVSTDDGGTWSPITLALGSREGLATTPGGKSHVVVWDSFTDLLATFEEEVRLRIRAIDEPMPPARHATAWTTLTGIDVRNQTPPRIEALYVKNDGDIRTGRIPMTYRIVDAEADVTDVSFQYSVDLGASWLTCSEYPEPRSEGMLALASAPADDPHEIGVHTFIWDSTADLFSAEANTQVRVTPRDAEGVGPSTTLLPASIAGPVLEPPNDQPYGFFQDETTATCPLSCRGLGIADFNGDLAPDLVIGDAQDRTFAILLQDLDAGTPVGTFTPLYADADIETESAETTTVMEIAAEDFDEDGIYDLAILGEEGLVRVRLGTGSGSWDQGFAPTDTYDLDVDLGADVIADDMAVLDLDVDGVTDIVVLTEPAGGGTTELYALYGQGTDGAETGTFGAATLVSNAVLGSSTDIELADMDGDGLPDLISSNDASPNGACVSYHNGTTLAACVPMVTDSASRLVTVGDFNGDGRNDVVVSRPVGTTFTVALRDLREPSGWGAPIHVASVRIQRIVSTDWDGDNIEELAVLSNLINNFRLHTFTPAGGLYDGHFDSYLEVGTGTQRDRGWLSTRDINGDGVRDLVHVADDRQLTAVTFNPNPVPTSAALGATLSSSPQCLYADLQGANDLDDDGFADTMTWCANNDWRTAPGIGSGTVATASFGPRDIKNLGYAPADLADVDLDGVADLVFCGTFAVSFGVPDAHGAGAFGFAAPIVVDGALPSPYNGEDVRVADFNGDGLPDIAAVEDDFTNSQLHVYGGGGAARTFAPLLAHSATGRTRSALGIGDLNGDAVADIIWTTDDGVSINLSDGTGGLTAGPLQSVLPEILVDLQLCDLNRDGLLDIVGYMTNIGLTIVDGLGAGGAGNGTFDYASATTIAATQGKVVGCPDLNGDGWNDVVAVSPWPDFFEVYVMHSDGTGGFHALESYPSAEPWRDVLIRDVSNDGGLDLLNANVTANSINVRTSRFEGLTYDWRIDPWVWSASDNHGNLVGADTMVGATIDFGAIGSATIQNRLGRRRYHGPYDEGVAPPATPTTGAWSFKDEVVRALGGSLDPALTPITDAWVYSGDVRLTQVNDPATGGVTDTGARRRIDHRLGPVGGDGHRTELELDVAFASQRGVIVELPLYGAVPADASKVVVVRRTTDWLRASEMTADPMNAEADAHEYMPRVPNGSGGYRTVWRTRYDYCVIAKATETSPGVFDLTADQGDRFFVDSERSSVRVIAERLGVFQAFVAP